MKSLSELGDAIVQGQVELFNDLLNKYMNSSMSYYDTAETFYHGWLMGLLILDSSYFCRSNREAGEGRTDIMLQPRPGGKGPGLIFEFKYCKTPRQLSRQATEALKQIEKKRYIEEFPPEVTEVVGYGMSFCAKECKIKQRVWTR